MSDMKVAQNVKRASIRAVVYNADGTVKKDYGVVSYYDKNPLKRWWFKVKQFFRKR